jgi:hypothetical protein
MLESLAFGAECHESVLDASMRVAYGDLFLCKRRHDV